MSYHIGSTNNFDVFYYFYDIFFISFFFNRSLINFELLSDSILLCVIHVIVLCLVHVVNSKKKNKDL